MPITTITTDVSTDQLDRYARLIYDKIGVVISQQKATLLSNRLRRRLRATGLQCYDEYYELLKRTPSADPEWESFLQEVTTHETYLFRDKLHWDWLRDTFAAEIGAAARAGKRETTLRAWSAACSTGDETYTIACCLADRLPGWKLDILGTDVGAGAVAAARRGEFGERAMKMVPAAYRERYFQKATAGNQWSAKANLRSILRFNVHNLLEPLARGQRFDLVVLKNVLIYFDAKSKERVLRNVQQSLCPGGFLITGPAEGVSELLKDWQSTHGWLHRLPR